MKILVTGASGFLGRHLATELASRGHEVVAASRSGSADVTLEVADPTSCQRVVAEVAPDVVVNLAGAGVTAGSADDPAMVHANREGPGNVARASAAAGARMLHVASSTEPLPGMLPESFYSQTKADGTGEVIGLMGRERGAFAVARVHNAYGRDQPRGRFIIDVIERLSSGGEFTIRFPDRVRDFCVVDEVVGHLADLALADTSADRCFDIGTGVGITLRDAALAIQDAFGAEGSEVHWAEGPAADPAPSSVAGDAGMATLWCPTTLAAGLRKMREDRS